MDDDKKMPVTVILVAIFIITLFTIAVVVLFYHLTKNDFEAIRPEASNHIIWSSNQNT